MDSLIQDLRYALRQLRRSPGFAAAAILTLALGIGANTAIFGVFDAAILESPPVVEPERLVAVYTTCRDGDPRCSSSYPDYVDYRDRSGTIDDLAAYTWTTASLGSQEDARLALVQPSTGNYFRLLGVRPGLGRLLGPDDDRRGAARRVAVLSHDLWREAFGGDTAAVGRTIRLNSASFEVVGVTPEGFQGLHLDGGPDLWIPLLAGSALGTGFFEDDSRFDNRGSRWIAQLVGRLAPDATVERARAEMLAISNRLAEEDPAARGPRSVTVDAIPGRILPAGARGDLARFVWILAGVVALILLLACANVANLLLARAAARHQELGIRRAIGAGRGRLIRQLVTEGIVLGSLGGATGLLLSRWLLRALASFELPGGVSVGVVEAGFDLRAFAIAAVVSAAAVLLFAVLPALRASRADPSSMLQAETRVAGGRAGGLRQGLVALQTALCLILLVGAGLFVRTLDNALEHDPGFRSEGVAVASYDAGLLGYTREEQAALAERLLERVRAAPGIASASLGSLVPLSRGGFSGFFVDVEGYEPAPDEEMRVDLVFVAPDYFRTLGIPLLRGRAIRENDGPGEPVAVVNREMAARWWPGREAVGGTVRIGQNAMRVVGVVDEVNWRTLQEEETPFLYLPLSLSPARPVTLAARHADDASVALPAIRDAFRTLDPAIALRELGTLEERLARVLMPQRMGAVLLLSFALLALALAAVGIYGVVAYTVARESRALGIRIALGARPAHILSSVARRIAPPVLGGLLAGAVGALLLAGTAERFLFGVRAEDPLAVAALAALLASVAAAAALIPARRATRIDPAATLREE